MSSFTNKSGHSIEVEVYEKTFLLLKCQPEARLWLSQLGDSLQSRKPEYADDIICSEDEFCISLNASFNYNRLEELAEITVRLDPGSESWVLPVYFHDTEDWNRVKEIVKLDSEEIVEFLTTSQLHVQMLGFLPGFVYLDGLPTILHIDRKSKPSPRVEPGSFAIASHYAGVYSIPSPGGWYVLGKAPCALTNLPDMPPTWLRPGDKVSLQAISKSEYLKLEDHNVNIIEYNGKS